MLTGNCLCKAVKFHLEDKLLYSFYCYCSECRRFSGSAFSVAGGIAREKLIITNGEKQIKYYRKRDVANLAFCGICGSSLFSENFKMGLIHLRYGVLNEEPSLKPQSHIHVASKIPWYEIADDLPQFETLPPSKTK